MKIIFLDIDGVLVTRRIGTFEDDLLRNLKRVVDETGATIVLSSDWRRHPAARAEAKRVLATVGLCFIAWTPIMSAYIAQRPTEIMQWKKDYCKRADAERITNWIAIDDRALLEERHGSYLRGHFVQTHVLRGLTEMAADECIASLNQEPPPHPPAPATGKVSNLARTEAADALGWSNPLGEVPRGSFTSPLAIVNTDAAKRNSLPSRGLAVLGAGGLASYGISDGSSSRPDPAGLPSLGRQRGRSVGAPPMVGKRR
jgi:hypothetical protein